MSYGGRFPSAQSDCARGRSVGGGARSVVGDAAAASAARNGAGGNAYFACGAPGSVARACAATPKPAPASAPADAASADECRAIARVAAGYASCASAAQFRGRRGRLETFKSLAEAGISDPSAVSQGIGVALLATAFGIATALYGLLFFNVFQSQENRVLDIMKLILMRVGFARPN